MYIVYVYVVLTLVMRGKPRNEVQNTTVTTTAHLIYCCHMTRYDFANAILYFGYVHYYACIPLFNEKHCTLIVYITEFSQKWGGMHYWPPNPFWGGGHGPPGLPPCGGPHVLQISMLKLKNNGMCLLWQKLLNIAKTSKIFVETITKYAR